MANYLVCITGASGAVYGLRAMEALTAGGHEAHCIASEWGKRVIKEETGREFSDWTAEWGIPGDRVYDAADLAARPASGSFRLRGTVIAPCSMHSAGAIASGLSLNLVHRAGLVALKEGWPLVVVPRETPLSLPDLRNLTALAEAGAAIVPASPAFYHKPRHIDDLVDFVVGKVLDRLAVEHSLFTRWKGLP
jgi:4-hydroxy-3-polyprenylbenzoate decarboxylase